jgi:hypothetical protein
MLKRIAIVAIMCLSLCKSIKFVVYVNRAEGAKCFYQALSKAALIKQQTKNISSRLFRGHIKIID